MPDAAGRIRGMLGIDSAEPWTALQAGTLAAGHNCDRSNRCSRASKRPSRNYAA